MRAGKVMATGLTAMTAVLPVAAQRPSRALTNCLAIEEPAARLACYDAALGRTPPPPGTGAPPRIPPPSAPIARAGPVPRAIAPRPAMPVVATVDSRVTAVAALGNDLFRFQLADGSVWRTGEQGVQPRPGDPVRIRRSVLAYYATIGTRGTVGVRPVR